MKDVIAGKTYTRTPNREKRGKRLKPKKEPWELEWEARNSSDAGRKPPDMEIESAMNGQDPMSWSKRFGKKK